MHNGHTVLKITDGENLEKENISIETYAKNLDNITKKITNLNDMIINEIEKINNLYDKINEEVSNSYKIKHENLLKEENDLKDKLKNEVTKVKEKLEIFLTEANEKIKLSEKINKSLKNLKIKENMIKLLSYIQKIDETENSMNSLSFNLMRNLDISFIEKKNIIKYDEYYFNGLPTPKDIEVKDVTQTSANIIWKIDKLNINNIDNEKIKFKLEMKKEGKKFIEIYEGNNNNYKVFDLKVNTNYEFRICTIYNDLISPWIEIKKIKTLDYDYTCESIILLNSKRKEEFLRKIYEWSGNYKLELLYRATRDGDTASNFHNKCNNQGPTITLFETDKNNIFGGYTSKSWTSQNSYSSDPNCFIFTLKNTFGIKPNKFKIKEVNNSIYDYYNKGPTFGSGHDIYIYDNFLNSNSHSINFPKSFEDNKGIGKSIFIGDNNSSNFTLKELEVFTIVPDGGGGEGEGLPRGGGGPPPSRGRKQNMLKSKKIW